MVFQQEFLKKYFGKQIKMRKEKLKWMYDLRASFEIRKLVENRNALVWRMAEIVSPRSFQSGVQCQIIEIMSTRVDQNFLWSTRVDRNFGLRSKFYPYGLRRSLSWHLKF